VWEKTESYLKRAGTVIMLASILIWIITTFPTYELPETELTALKTTYLTANPSATDVEVAAYLSTNKTEEGLRHSFAGMIGSVIEPIFKPLGFNWKLSIATITGFAAKEVIVSTLGVVYRVGEGENEQSGSLINAISNDQSLGPRNALAFMLFVLLIPPCLAALATIKAEAGWKWLLFEIVFLLCLGWLVAFLVFQLGAFAS
jgi:ferrous iron transport protein B